MSGLENSDYDSRTGMNKAETVKDPHLLDLANAGADWFCLHCESGNKGNGDRCVSCGSPRYDSGEPRFEKPTQHPHADLQEDDPLPQDDNPHVTTAVFGGSGALLAGGALLILMLFALGFWAMQTHPIMGKVTAMTWVRTVHIEQWTPIKVRLWQHQTTERAEIQPVSGAGERAGFKQVADSCRQEHFRNERYVCGNHQECKDIYRNERESYSCTSTQRYACGESCTSSKNGFARCHTKYCTRTVRDTCHRTKRVFDHKECHTVNDYCTRPIYETKCDYITQQWAPVGERITSGTGKDFSWGASPQGDPWRHSYSASYLVTATYKDRGKEHQYAVVSDKVSRTTKVAAELQAKDYLTWNVQDDVLLDINNLGGVHKASHMQAEKE